MNPLIDAEGTQFVPDDTPPTFGLKRWLFDWSSVVAIVIATMSYVSLQGDVRTNARELERKTADIMELKAWKDERVREDRIVAQTMATRADVKEVADQVRALAAELRMRNNR